MKRLHAPVHMLSLIHKDAASNSDPAKVSWQKCHARVTLVRYGFLASHTFRTLPRLRDLQTCKMSMSKWVILKHERGRKISFEKLICSKVKCPKCLTKCPKCLTNFIPHDTLHLY